MLLCRYLHNSLFRLVTCEIDIVQHTELHKLIPQTHTHTHTQQDVFITYITDPPTALAMKCTEIF